MKKYAANSDLVDTCFNVSRYIYAALIRVSSWIDQIARFDAGKRLLEAINPDGADGAKGGNGSVLGAVVRILSVLLYFC